MSYLALTAVCTVLFALSGWFRHEKLWQNIPTTLGAMLIFLLLSQVAAPAVFPFTVTVFAALAGLASGTLAGHAFNRTAFGSSQYRFCPSCAARLEKRDFEGHEKLACPRCDFVYWNNPIIVGVALIPSLDRKSIALVKRGVEPQIGKYCLPGGFGEPYEHPKDTARREAGEEANVDIEIDKLYDVRKAPDRNQALIFYLAKPTSAKLTPGSDAQEAEYFPLDALPEIAFITHRQVIDKWREELANER